MKEFKKNRLIIRKVMYMNTAVSFLIHRQYFKSILKDAVSG